MKNKEIFLVGNKKDIDTIKNEDRKVLGAEGVKFAHDRKIFFREVSSYNYGEVDGVFTDLVRAIMDKVENGLVDKESLLFSKDQKGHKLAKK